MLLTSSQRVLALWEGGSSSHVVGSGASLTIGRHRDCEIVIDLPSVSRRHARLTAGEPSRIEDVGGMNGVRVRGLRIPTGQPVAVDAGDIIELGGAVVVLQGPRKGGALQEEHGSRVTQAPGESPMRAVDRLVDLVARSELSVLLAGEKGVGKSVTAQAIHDRSSRAKGPYLRLPCAAFPEALLEGDALLASAAGGTVLLDEIDEMPLAAQAKLVGMVGMAPTGPPAERRGSAKAPTASVRFVATTRVDLAAHVAEGKFRADLHERLDGISVLIPPLRERAADIPLLAHRFLSEACTRAGRLQLAIASEAMDSLLRHPFPGNLSELRDAMERASTLARGASITRSHVVFESSEAVTPRPVRRRKR